MLLSLELTSLLQQASFSELASLLLHSLLHLLLLQRLQLPALGHRPLLPELLANPNYVHIAIPVLPLP